MLSPIISKIDGIYCSSWVHCPFKKVCVYGTSKRLCSLTLASMENTIKRNQYCRKLTRRGTHTGNYRWIKFLTPFFKWKSFVDIQWFKEFFKKKNSSWILRGTGPAWRITTLRKYSYTPLQWISKEPSNSFCHRRNSVKAHTEIMSLELCLSLWKRIYNWTRTFCVCGREIEPIQKILHRRKMTARE